MQLELYSEQDVETKVVVPALQKLGYDERSNEKVTLRFRHPIKAHQGRETRTIIADVIVFVDDTPVIVVDAKNPRKYLTENDREQVISYARLLREIALYAALCNGHTWQIYDAVTKQQIAVLPHYDALLADVHRRRLLPRQRESLVKQATRTLFAIDNARELSRIMRRCHDVIRNLKGYDPTKAFDELSKMLFAKMFEEREVAEGQRVDNRFTLASVQAMRKQGVEIIQTLWRNTVESPHYKEIFSDQDSVADIELPPEAIDQIVSILEDKSLGLTDLDVKGVAFEEFLAATYRGGGLGQFFTPRSIVSFMVDLVDPAIGERVIDPSCGTGGFLIRVYDVVSEKIRSSELSDKEKEEKLALLANAPLVGIDWEQRAARTCKMNMIIHGDGHAGVYQANSLDIAEVHEKVSQRRQFFPSAPTIENESFDIVLTNPPFGARDRLQRILAYYKLGASTSQKREVLMLERCIQLLCPGGRMAVVIPEGILSNKNDRHIREFIREKCVIKALIRLPQEAFKMSEGAANTSILYIIKKDPQNPKTSKQGDIFFARAEHIGMTPAGKPIDKNDLPLIREQFRLFEEGQWQGITLESIDETDMAIQGRSYEKHELWLEPEVNRTNLLYDQLAYVVHGPIIEDRFSYTYFHPHYYSIMHVLRQIPVSLVPLESLCQEGYPTRGKKPAEEVSEGSAILKVRNITGRGIDFDTDYVPDSEELHDDKGVVQQHDILITSTGEGTIGRVDVYMPDELAFADGHVTICRLQPNVNYRYIVEFLRSEFGQIQMLRHVSGSTGQTELLIDPIKSILIPIPDERIQELIVERMDMAKTISDELVSEARQLQMEGAQVIASGREHMIEILSNQGDEENYT